MFVSIQFRIDHISNSQIKGSDFAFQVMNSTLAIIRNINYEAIGIGQSS